MRFELRYWDGARWTEHVSQAGAQQVDAAERREPEGTASPGTTGDTRETPDLSASLNAAEAAVTDHIPLFGARNRARELAREARSLQAEVQRLNGQVQRLDHLGALSVVELEERRRHLENDIEEQRSSLERERVAVEQELERARNDAVEALQRELAAGRDERERLAARVAELRSEVVVTEDAAVLQEVGIYEYRHPLTDAVAYQAELRRLRDRAKVMTRKDGGAVHAATDWTVNGSLRAGRAMVRDFSKLMLRAYNAEADNLVRAMKPYKLDTSIERLTKVATTIVKLGKTMDIRISDAYHSLRIAELELTADYLEHLAEQKEREREERERLREERRAQQEMERERARLEKDRQHHANALAALKAKGDEDAAARLEAQLSEIDRKIEDVDYRAANIRAGYVYVISNLGSFGESIVKVGLTRRLDPQDRVRELGDASVPFRFDVHALFFSDDAVGIEAKLHERLAERRVNSVNRRREFFYATPAEVKTHLMDLTGELLEYQEMPEALEYRQSLRARPVTTP
jgi:hypothetical protein